MPAITSCLFAATRKPATNTDTTMGIDAIAPTKADAFDLASEVNYAAPLQLNVNR
jgi:hypothetical protein